jgi:hypothetical protein
MRSLLRIALGAVLMLPMAACVNYQEPPRPAPVVVNPPPPGSGPVVVSPPSGSSTVTVTPNSY